MSLLLYCGFSTEPAEVRSRFIADKLKDLPEIYRQQMPATNVLHELAQAEQRIRSMYREDWKAAGGKVPDVSGAAPMATTGNVKPGDVFENRPGSSVSNISAGLQTLRSRGADPNVESR